MNDIIETNLVSIVMPSYNCASFIKPSIESVLNQTYEFWELLVIDDCSTDNTLEVLNEFSNNDSRVKVFILEENSGAAVARNKGIENAQGDYIAFLDSDDVWLPNKLQSHLSFMKVNNFDFSSTSYSFIDENDNPSVWMKVPPKHCNYWKMLFLNNPVGNSTIMYKREHLLDIRVPLIRKRNDFALWLQILKRVDECAGYHTVLTNYRHRSDSLSRNKRKLIKYHWYLYREIEKLPIIVSIAAMVSWGAVKIFRYGYHKKKGADL